MVLFGSKLSRGSRRKGPVGEVGVCLVCRFACLPFLRSSGRFSSIPVCRSGGHRRLIGPRRKGRGLELARQLWIVDVHALGPRANLPRSVHPRALGAWNEIVLCTHPYAALGRVRIWHGRGSSDGRGAGRADGGTGLCIQAQGEFWCYFLSQHRLTRTTRMQAIALTRAAARDDGRRCGAFRAAGNVPRARPGRGARVCAQGRAGGISCDEWGVRVQGESGV